MEETHRASADVDACAAVLRYKPFWDARENHLSFFKSTELISYQHQPDLDDLDTDGNESDESNSVDDDASVEAPQRLGWKLNTDFEGVNSKSNFEEMFRLTSQNSNVIRTGLQCSDSSVNSPMKAWRQVFTHAILEKIVLHTNQYGIKHCKDWPGICRQDITDFIAVLFIGEFFCSQICLQD